MNKEELEKEILSRIEKYVGEPCQLEVTIDLRTFIEGIERNAFEAGREESVFPDTTKGRGGIGGQTLTSGLTYENYESYKQKSL